MKLSRRTRAGIGLVAALSATLPLTPAQAGYPGDNGVIAFGGITRHAGFDADIYTINPDGTGLTRLPSGPGADLCPAYRRDGGRLAFCSNRTGAWEIHTMDPDGSNQQQVTALDGLAIFPDFSPSGRTIAFNGFAAGDDEDVEDIFLVNVDGTRLRRLTDTPDHSEQYPVWSPRGSRIAFLDLTFDDAGNEVWQIHTIKPNGKDRRQVTFDDTWKDQTVEWSPDGDRIAYVADADVWIVDADGTNQHRLLSTPEEEFGLAWSPDGRYLTFLRIHGSGQRGLYRVGVDGTDERLLYFVEGGPNPAVPAWQPLR